jgi:hypothetical protein
MRRLPALTVLLVACGGSPCEAWVDAVLDCYADAGVPAPAGVDVDTQCPDAGSKSSDAYYRCLQDAWENGDCSTVEGIAGIGDEAAGCTPE